jgi:hypothetical protein
VPPKGWSREHRSLRAHISRRLRVADALAILATLTATPAWGQDSLLWGGLKPGPYSVGYRKLAIDLSNAAAASKGRF